MPAVIRAPTLTSCRPSVRGQRHQCQRLSTLGGSSSGESPPRNQMRPSESISQSGSLPLSHSALVNRPYLPVRDDQPRDRRPSLPPTAPAPSVKIPAGVSVSIAWCSSPADWPLRPALLLAAVPAQHSTTRRPTSRQNPLTAPRARHDAWVGAGRCLTRLRPKVTKCSI